MKDSGEETTQEAASRAADKKSITVSARKVAANRQNAAKSTGPRTARGKAHSGRNAIKHGLFVMQFMDFNAQGEDPEKYEELLGGLRAQYHPIGTAEELEVERIAVCWWRLKRAWRYENVVNRVALRDIGRREREEQKEYCKTLDQQEEAVILQLHSAQKEIEVTGEISQEAKQKIFAAMPGLEAMWPAIEKAGEELLNSLALSKTLRKLSAKERASSLAVCTTIAGVKFLELMGQWRAASVLELSIAQHVIPNSEALDKILRYETAIDRSLGRALDRLERLQRRRRGEPVPPPVSVRLTQ
jgi:hypothetical protein